MTFEILSLMNRHTDLNDFNEMDKYPKNVQDIINLIEPEYTSEDIACINRFEIDEIGDNKLKMYFQSFIDILSEFTEDGINSLEDLNKVYIRTFSGRLDIAVKRVKDIFEATNIDISKMNEVELEDSIADILLNNLQCTPVTIQTVASRISSRIK